MDVLMGELLAREARHRVANDLAVAAAALRLSASGALSPVGLEAAVARIEGTAEINAVLCREPAAGVVDLADALGRLFRPLARMAAASGWTLVFRIDHAVVEDADAMRVGMMVSELVGNAVRHAPRAGAPVVEVVVERVRGVLTLRVDDGGDPREWTRPGGQGGRIVDALALAMVGSVARGGDASRPGAVEISLPFTERVASEPAVAPEWRR